MILLYIALGFSQGIMPLVNYNYAGRDGRRMKDTVLFVVKLAVCFMIAVSVRYYLGAPRLIRLFMKNETIVQYRASFLRRLCIVLPFLCLDFLAVGDFRRAIRAGRSLFLPSSERSFWRSQRSSF